MEYAPIRCSVCGTEFIPKRRHQIHDKPACRFKKWNDKVRAILDAHRASHGAKNPAAVREALAVSDSGTIPLEQKEQKEQNGVIQSKGGAA